MLAYSVYSVIVAFAIGLIKMFCQAAVFNRIPVILVLEFWLSRNLKTPIKLSKNMYD